LSVNQDIDIVRVQDIGLSGEDDPVVLEWAANERCVLLTHDVTTITRFAYERLAQDLAMPGVVEIRTDAPVGRVIEDIFIILECGVAEDLDGQVYYLPLCGGGITLRWCGRYRGYRWEFKVICRRTTSPLACLVHSWGNFLCRSLLRFI
jgi:hypothetical protein